MSFCDISFNRKSGVVTDVLNKEGRESALYPQLVSYVQQDPQTVYDSKKEYFDTLVDQGKLVEGKVKEGVGSLFESNPELANVVYDNLIPKGYTRLYRVRKIGEKPTYDPKGNWIYSSEQIKEREKYFGRWFSKDKTDIDWYIKDRSQKEDFSDVEVVYVDIPTNELNKYKEYDKTLSRKSEDEFVLPTELASGAKNINNLKQQAQQLYSQYVDRTGKQDIEGFKSFVQKQKVAPLSPDELALGLYSIAYNSGVSEQEFMDRINRDGNLSVFGVGGQVGGQQVFNQVKTASAEIDLNLSNKIQKMLQEKYPEIKLNITNAPVWEQEGNIFNQEEYISQVNYRLKAIEILSSDKAKQIFDKGKKAGWSLDKILTELQIPKEQKKIILDLNITDRDAIVVELATSYSYDVQIDIKPTTAYSELSVPGGTKYTEIEIATPAIIPSIKGHAQFATDNGIGWFRSDEKLPENYYGERGLDWKYENDNKTIKHTTRRILEVQSDLFQKGRDKEDLVTTTRLTGVSQAYNNISSFEIDGNLYFSGMGIYMVEPIDQSKPPVKITYSEFENNRTKWFEQNSKTGSSENQFLQLLNKDNNWVNFFVKSIIQDSAKKGYEKVLFPSGNTASKVEGHDTEEEFKKRKENRIKRLQKKIDNDLLFEGHIYERISYDNTTGLLYTEYIQEEQKDPFSDESVYTILSKDEYEKLKKENKEKDKQKIENEINQLKTEIEKVEKEGFGALRPIYNFYENTVANILKKQGYNPVQITDEYGNTWNEVTINQNRDLQNVLLQRDDSRRIIGQANIKAMTVLIDAVNQKQDTLPHEYAHHYIAWFRNTPMVRQAISQWGSEEALVQAIGEQVVAQKGEALNWWKRFVRLILSMFGKVSNKDRENIKNMLTNAFLEGKDLQTGQVGISRERSKELAGKTKDENVNTFLDEVKNTRLSADNAIFASRLKNLDTLTKGIKMEEMSNISGAARFDAFNNKVYVSNAESLLSDTIAFENVVLEEIMVGAAQNGLKIGQLTIPFVDNLLKELRKRNQWQKERNMGLDSYQESYLENTNNFVSAYLKADKQFVGWVKSMEPNSKALQSIIAKEIAESMFQTNEKYFTAKLEKYFSEIGNATKAIAPGLVKDANPITNNLQDLREDYAAVQKKYGNEFTEKDIQKNPEKYATVLKTIEMVNKNYGGNVLKILKDGETRKIKVDLKEMERLNKEAKKEKTKNNKKQNNAEFGSETKTRMVDSIPELEFLSEDEKRIAEDMLQSGEFQIFCGL